MVADVSVPSTVSEADEKELASAVAPDETVREALWLPKAWKEPLTADPPAWRLKVPPPGPSYAFIADSPPGGNVEAAGVYTLDATLLWRTRGR